MSERRATSAAVTLHSSLFTLHSHHAIASLEIRFSENFIVPCFRALASAMAYAIASDEIRFSEKSLAISFLSLASGRKTMRWPFTMLEGENSFWAITSAG